MAGAEEPPLRVAGIEYRLSMPRPHSHLLEVEVRASASGGPLELLMPSWTPGSYLMREFPRNVQDFSAATAAGEPLAWRKTDKNTWRIDAVAGTEVVAAYRVYANELSVRTSHLDASHAFVNGASVFMFVRGREREALSLEIDAPEGWNVATSLRSPSERRLEAESYDRLVDGPLEIGTHEVLEWEQEGIPHRYALWGAADLDRERLMDDTRRIVAAASRLFGGLPYERYLFILHVLPEGRGGLEHADSCALQADRGSFRGEGYENLLALVAHEFFHVWNVKRIRPETLDPFDYTRENYTRNLFVAEGLTTYYTDLMLRRAGLMAPERYVVRLGESISRLQALPGRHHQSLEESSFDAWIKFYRPDEHTPNSQVSYYHKGALVGLLLDMEIRRATGGARSMDDLMRLLWERYGSRDVGFPENTREGIQALAEEVAGGDLGEFFDVYLRGTAELEYDRHLEVVGLRLERAEGSAEGSGLAGAQAAPNHPGDVVAQETRLGVRTREQEGRLKVTHVLEGTAAFDAGLNAGDEIAAVAGRRTGAAELERLLHEREEGELEIAAFRRGELLRFRVPLGPHPAPKLRLARLPDASPEQRAALADWLRGEGGASLDRIPTAG